MTSGAERRSHSAVHSRAASTTVHGEENEPRGARVQDRNADGGGSQIVIDGRQPPLPAAARPAGAGARGRFARGAATANSSRCSGPRGCGKSTLLYLIGGFLPTETGKILVEGKPVAGPGPDRGIVFQHFALFPVEDGARQRPVRAREAGHAARGARAARASDSSISSACPASRTAIPRSSPAA